MGKWDGSNLVLFNLVHHHQEREDEVTRLATSAATDLFIHTGKSPLLRSGVAPQSLVGWGLMI